MAVTNGNLDLRTGTCSFLRNKTSNSELATKHEGISYTIQCNISTAKWLSDNVLHIFNNPSTFNPTKIPTTEPIAAPTYTLSHINNRISAATIQ